MERENYTRDEWYKEGVRRFGENLENWRFRCPHCGNIASGAEFRNAGASSDVIYCECIGRYVRQKGCNWAAYGLFDICNVHVDGHPVFEFADADDQTDQGRV